MDDLWTEFEVEITEMLNESVKQAFIAGYEFGYEGVDYDYDPDGTYKRWVTNEQS